MKNTLIGVLLTGMASTAMAQNAPTFDFKGIAATDSYEQHKTAFQKCEKYFNFQGCKFKDREVAGVLAFPEAGWTDDGRLVLIRGTVAEFNYRTLVEGFRQKWGAPDLYTEIDAQNGYGAKIKIPVSVWNFVEGEMKLTGPSFRTDGRFEFVTHERKAYLEGLDKPKADF